MLSLYIALILLISTLLTLQGLLSLWQMLAAWQNGNDEDDLERLKPQFVARTFISVIIPAYREEKVIGDTLTQLAKQKYPKNLFEIVLPLAKADFKTIEAVMNVKKQNPQVSIKPIVFDKKPVNKPDGLNKVLNETRGDYVVVFDAEDQVHTKLFAAIDSYVQQFGRKVLQTEVRLVNWSTRWFSLQNALEYYFWFVSRLKWHAEQGFVTLGGVSVFFPKEVLLEIGGWDKHCLTEDAKIGLTCSLEGFEIEVLNLPGMETEEETPYTLRSFVKQRTRWIQGFLQIFSSFEWLGLSRKNQVYFLIVFLFPLINFGLYIWFGISLAIALVTKLPMAVTLISFLPLTILVFQIVVMVAGVHDLLARKQQVWLMPVAIIIMIVTYFPYQILVSVCAIRAVYRNIAANYNWEKTTHENIHRSDLAIRIARN